MGKIKVKLDEAFCEKHKCKGPRHHRHHRGHEFLFAVRWEGSKDPKKIEWCQRYWKFRDEDIVFLCPEHHAEVHLAYDRIIISHNRGLHKPCDQYTVAEAESLRKELQKYCDKWLKKETKGVPPNRVFGRARTRNQRKGKKDGGEKKNS